ncbi:hypothetical protein DCAR_0311680 [Daucus carota subsp. sativus]|uniref:Uncharacterized protein n=1 Tax=Daucus carota subsp. sativus TaxID=79200 RepID=A0AAF1AR56_DAUCS|nr:hypothetical protein DCAR_0311680 [Daucus carota subsp. sativus]
MNLKVKKFKWFLILFLFSYLIIIKLLPLRVYLHFADNPSVYHQKREICECATKYDHGCVLYECEGLCTKIDLTIAAYCSDKSTCLCIYVC